MKKTILTLALLALPAAAGAQVRFETNSVPLSPASFNVAITTATCVVFLENTGGSSSTVTVKDRLGATVFSKAVAAGQRLLDFVKLTGKAASPFTIEATAAGVRLSSVCLDP